MMKFILYFGLFLSASLHSRDVEVKGYSLKPPEVISLSLHHARTPSQITWGFMNVSELRSNEGMLFYFTSLKKRNFWMFNCLINLDLAFLDENLTIKEISELIAYPEIMDPKRPVHSISDMNRLYPRGDPVRNFFSKHASYSRDAYAFALELPHKFFETKDINVGWSLIISKDGSCALHPPIDLSVLNSDQASWLEVSDENLYLNYWTPVSSDNYYLYELSKSNHVIQSYQIQGLTDLAMKKHSQSFKKHPECKKILMIKKKKSDSSSISVGDRALLK